MARRTRARACTGKTRHGDRDQAYAHLQRLVAKGAAWPALQVYRCRYCRMFHVGHAPRPRRYR